jgi:hypothetical protein
MMPLKKRNKNFFFLIPNFKGIDDNTQFLRGGQCDNPLKSDMGQVGKHDRSASEQVMET